MLTTLSLLLVTQVFAEWVEISQQHYRKPMRTYNPFTIPDKIIDVEETTKPWTFNNYSITEHNWNKHPRTPNIGNVKRVQPVVTVKSTERTKFEDFYPDLDVDISDYEMRPNYVSTRVSNVGSIKRVQLDNSPVRSPSINLTSDGNINFDDHHKTYFPKDDMPLTAENEFEYKTSSEPDNQIINNNKRNTTYLPSDHKNISTNEGVHILNKDRSKQEESSVKNIKIDRDKNSNNGYQNNFHDDEPQVEVEFAKKRMTADKIQRIYVNNIKDHHDTDKLGTSLQFNEDIPVIEDVTIVNEKRLTPEYENYTITKNLFSPNPTFISETENINNYVTQENRRFYKITDSKTSEATEKYEVSTTQNIYTNEDSVTKPTIDTNVKSNEYKNNIYVSKTDSPETKEHVAVKNKGITDATTNELVDKTTMKTKPDQNSQFGKVNQTALDDKNNVTSKEAKKGVNKVNTMENIVKFMRVVADTISRNSRRSFGGKVHYLHELKNSILTNIEERIDSSWPDDDATGAHRHSRSAHASPRGSHVHFPSSESALMTISFLTFAVFLIKLVLQVIHTYKNKTMMVAPLVVASAGRNMFTHHGRH